MPSTRATSPKAKPAALPPPTASERAFEAALERLLRGEQPASPIESSGQGDASPDRFVENAFARSEQFIGDRYATIAEATSFFSKLAGVSFEGRQDTIAGLRAGAALELVREPENPHDPNAIAVRYGNLQLGFIKRGIAAHIAPNIDAGIRYRAQIASLTGTGAAGKHRGVNILVERDAQAIVAQRSAEHAAVRERWDGDRDVVRRALIGEAHPHAAQLDVLERVESGRNTLAVLGTGRGKSFCFQYPAALRALAGGGKTLVIYPLRALANDQFEALHRKLDPLGLRILRANGSIGAQDREELFAALREGAWDIVLATPEFLTFHREAFSGVSSPAFVVVDEAHHLYESKHRAAYATLGETIASLGSPQVLALTATAADAAFSRIVEALQIDAWVIDPTVRENLHLVDARNTKDKFAYLERIFAAGEKGIVYCNSRREATAVADKLRGRLGNVVMFYHGGMPTKDRHEVERYFREGALRIVVATSAFGEGIDLPDVRHVVLYHLNFDFAEFNQQAGRAGRDGADAQIHLLYGDNDRKINEFLIDLDAPTLSLLRELYRGMKGLASGDLLRSGFAEIARTLDLDKARDSTVAVAVRIFEEAGLIEVGEDDDGRYLRFLRVDGKVDLAQNERFAEGEATREAFDRFCTLALGAKVEQLEAIVNRPIYPQRAQHRR